MGHAGPICHLASPRTRSSGTATSQARIGLCTPTAPNHAPYFSVSAADPTPWECTMNEPERASWCTRSIHVRRLGCWGQLGEALPKMLRRRLSAKGVIGPDGQNVWIQYETLYPLLERINRSGVPVYLVNGWYDIYARGNFRRPSGGCMACCHRWRPPCDDLRHDCRSRVRGRGHRYATPPEACGLVRGEADPRHATVLRAGNKPSMKGMDSRRDLTTRRGCSTLGSMNRG
jgi:hypothetical protein